MGRWTIKDVINKGLKVSGGFNYNPEKIKTHSEIYTEIDFSSYDFFIPGNVPSSKNSRQNFTATDKNGIPLLNASGKKKTLSLPSKIVREYKKNIAKYFADYINSFHAKAGNRKPLRVEFLFVRDSKRQFDFHNAVQILADLMQEYKWIANDNAEHFLAVPPATGSAFIVDKAKPGVYIKILTN